MSVTQASHRGKYRYALVAGACLIVMLAAVFFGPYLLRHDAATAACGLNLGGAAGGDGAYSVVWMPVPVPGWECNFRPSGAEQDTVEFLPWWT